MTKNGASCLMIVYELMSSDLAKLLETAVEKQKSKLSHESKSSPEPQSNPQSPRTPGHLLDTHVLLRVLRDVSAGLAHLHSHGVVHRDVKPANILLRDEQVKLCDFGSSKDLQQRYAADELGWHFGLHGARGAEKETRGSSSRRVVVRGAAI